MSDPVDAPDLRAAEYVMGLLDAAEMLAVRRDALSDRRLANAIAEWERRLAPLVDLAPPIAPPPQLWSRIDQEIARETAQGGSQGSAAAGSPGRSGDAGGETVVRLRPMLNAARRPDWDSPRLWRATTAAALALAAVFAAIAWLPGQAPPSVAASALAALAPTGGPAPAFLAEARPDGRILISAVAPAAVPDGKDLELWLVPPGAPKPISLGVLPSGGKTMLLAAAPPAGSQLLVTLEVSGGSPTGQPQGQLLYGGKLTVREAAGQHG